MAFLTASIGENCWTRRDSKHLDAPRYRVLRPEDEEEVERLYFLLKTVGHIDPRNSGDER